MTVQSIYKNWNNHLHLSLVHHLPCIPAHQNNPHSHPGHHRANVCKYSGHFYTGNYHHDRNENVVEGNVQVYNSEGCLIKTPKGKLVIVEGLKDYLVVDVNDVLVICQKGNDANIKSFARDSKDKWGDKYL